MEERGLEMMEVSREGGECNRDKNPQFQARCCDDKFQSEISEVATTTARR